MLYFSLNESAEECLGALCVIESVCGESLINVGFTDTLNEEEVFGVIECPLTQ